MVQEMEPGRVLAGRYRLSRQERSGRYGRVWRAYDQILQVEVTVEAVGAADAPETHRVVRSLTTAAISLRGHPSVIVVNDVVEAGGVLWAVVPFVAGPSLADHLAEHGPMPVERVQQVARELLAALEAMHEAGVAHGDVRPANIRLAHSRWVLLPGTDALTLADLATTQEDVETFAAADYIAPEVMNGVRRRPSNDLFSLGATLYHLIMGYAPFQRDSVVETLGAVVREDPPPLGDIGELGRLIEGLLVKDPERRLTVAGAQRVLHGSALRVPAAAGATPPAEAPARVSVSLEVGAARWGLRTVISAVVLTVGLVVALTLVLAHLRVADVAAVLVTLLPWAVFVLGVRVLAVQARAALARRRSPGVPVWRGYVRSLAPPAPWTGEERDRRRAAAERAVDEALLRVDRRVAAASPGRGRGTSDV
ncbi:serine/threonine-protein kinase [Streptomyces cinerochromogenes]|uniref:serine/threonine-protein kinase n=1 Tax=Streptomyces cinerochromogenes TaxID=66422 RepID=UPI0033ACECDB